MAQVPVPIVHKFEIRQSKLFLYKFSQSVLNRLGPFANKNNELINSPSHSATWDLSVITFELRFNMLCLGTIKLLGPHLPMQVRIVNKRFPLFSSLLNLAWSKFLPTDAKKAIISWIIPKDSHAWHPLFKGFHILHLRLMFFITKLRHTLSVTAYCARFKNGFKLRKTL